MGRKKWVVSPCDKQLAKELAEECGIDSLVALILVARGITEPFKVDQLLDEEEPLGDPFEFIDMDKAVDRINKAIKQKEKICVYGDYDADGITSTVILYSFLKEKNAEVIYMVPEREDGYGLNKTAVDQMKEQGIALMITVDNGITAFEEIEYANSLGIDTVVTDHHLPQDALPNAYAIVDPHRKDCPSAYKSYAGAGVAFKLVCALSNQSGEEIINQYGDLVAIGTVADLMPLDGENRLIVKRGIKQFANHRPGLDAILEVAAYKREITSTAVSFTVAPRLNAAGRVGECVRAVRLLLAEDKQQALQIAEDINASNAQRQSIERSVVEEAVKLIEEKFMMYDRVIVVNGEGWHHGIIGIVASRICEKYGRPAIVLSRDGELACGSARSVGEFSLYDAIKACEDLLDKFGGHEQAAGVSMPIENVDLFRERINQYAKEKYGDMPFNQINIDCKLRLGAITPDVVHSLETLAPFGSGNPIPVFGLFGVKIERLVSVAQGKHLRVEVSKNGETSIVMAFGKTVDDFGYAVDDIVDIAVTADTNEYMGKEQVTLTMKDIRLNCLNQDKLLRDIRMYERFKRNEDTEQYRYCCKITREDVVAVYRLVKDGYNADSEKLIKDASMGYARMMICLECLKEIGVIEIESAQQMIRVQGVKIDRKQELENSSVYLRASNL